MLIEADPGRTTSQPISTWIGINLAGADADWDHVGDRIATSWELAAPRRLLEADDDERTVSERRRRRWINLGELIALAALLVSGSGRVD